MKFVPANKKIKKIFIFTLLAFLFISLTKNVLDYRQKLNFYESFHRNYEKEKKDNIILKTKALKNSDPYEVEKVIRNKLNLSKKR